VPVGKSPISLTLPCFFDKALRAGGHPTVSAEDGKPDAEKPDPRGRSPFADYGKKKIGENRPFFSLPRAVEDYSSAGFVQSKIMPSAILTHFQNQKRFIGPSII